VSGNPWQSPSGDALTPEPYQPPATAEPPAPYQPPQSQQPQQPVAPSFKPGYASLPKPPAAQPLAPTSMFPQQPGRSAPDGGRQGGYPPQPDPSQPYPPPPAYSPPSGYPAQPPYDQGPQPGYDVQHGGYGPPPGYGPPQPGYGPPAPPPKRSKVPFIAALLAITVLLCGGAATAGMLAFNKAKDRAEEAIKPITEPTLPTLPTEVPDLPGLPTGLPTDLPTLPTDVPGLPGPDETGKQITVGYEVTGDGPASIVYTEKLGDSPKRIDNATLPWTVEATMQGTTFVSVTAIRSGTGTGTISCRVTVDGKEVAHRTRKGTFATASCSKMVF
jgi:hypothetical protein